MTDTSAQRGVLNYTTMNNFVSYLKNVRAELAHVVWPKPKTAAIHTVLIIVISVIVAVFIGILDYALTSLVGFLINA